MIPALLQWILCIAPMELNCSKIWLETQNSHKECLVRTKCKRTFCLARTSRKQWEHHDLANICWSCTFKWTKFCTDEVATSFINSEHKIYSVLILMQKTLIKCQEILRMKRVDHQQIIHLFERPCCRQQKQLSNYSAITWFSN